MAGYLNRVSASLSDGEFHKLFVIPPPIGFEAARHFWIDCEGKSGIDGRWLNNRDGLQWRAK
jgi:hypothetical protein